VAGMRLVVAGSGARAIAPEYVDLGFCNGAGEGNRTLMTSLEVRG
jgi:hypothetical protein